MKHSKIRQLIGGLSLTTALFVFQACYGTPQDFGNDVLVEGQVKSKSTGLPIKGIKVTVKDFEQYEITDDEGRFSLYTDWQENITLQFEDVDPAQNGSYQNKDTVLTNHTDRILVAINLDEK